VRGQERALVPKVWVCECLAAARRHRGISPFTQAVRINLGMYKAKERLRGAVPIVALSGSLRGRININTLHVLARFSPTVYLEIFFAIEKNMIEAQDVRLKHRHQVITNRVGVES